MDIEVEEQPTFRLNFKLLLVKIVGNVYKKWQEPSTSYINFVL